ncbi:DUF1214 domain-containing protein [Alterisphingorhabdus coralli]|uniref:DUF1214 domain-containing protein n=1 Tax=Alterisphingorhabdus coralli TaxID=3071408 RepID=A0AA97FA85_9SPHN|nr:DUF1214 domain-containing protein [Parasphingorhabdus sp. SCSIO 66989]WOE76431.1 DUF1214 domain-containing protein [Parasphingorhabdus sp. SCSIO 66989]
MLRFLGYLLCILLGLGAGGGLAAWQLRNDSTTMGIANGPWKTAENIGSRYADMRTRAVVALRGLLALPDSEAVYYNAAVDSEGEALSGNCHYRVSGGALPARWWSVTAYDLDGYLLPNDSGHYSVGSGALPAEEQGNWSFVVGPDNTVASGGKWIEVVADAPFELTLRTYHPSKTLLEGKDSVTLPTVTRLACAQ